MTASANKWLLVWYVVPYYCARDKATLAFTDCIKSYDNINISALIDQTRNYELRGLIDKTKNMFNDRVFIFDGINDTVVLPGLSVDFITSPP